MIAVSKRAIAMRHTWNDPALRVSLSQCYDLSPLVGSICPESIFKNVDFPAPLAYYKSVTVAGC